ncbi:glycosyltransferase [Flavobacterium azooxidireducens]|uniref:Glycosyltransferase n=1 Tax=Flavobacterium azooxidireducens TaxID=1871076 RepID=A0ABY4KHV4_9FLAO|nr:glycosyltransferase [Flavobacterium azooxidireducens]UPQ79283.1 glycosyltransferase [Flavobacterium azooxidireducens]
MKILYFTKYTRKGASSRLRSFQYFPFLESQGNQVTVKPLFDDAYLESLYQGKKDSIGSLKGYFKRFFLLFTVFRYDRVVIEKELFPYIPAVFERVLALFGVNYVVDYDDAIFHNYDRHPNPVIRFVLKNKIDVVMQKSGTVIAGNSYLAERAQNAGAKNVVIIPTVIDTNRYQIKEFTDSKPFVIGWIGSPSTFKYLKPLQPVFKKLAQDHAIALHIVGATESLGLPSIEKHIPWSEETEVASILTFDVGIMPLNDTPWEKGKCSYKLIQYMGCGIPVIASPVGMNVEVVKEDVNGFLATNEAEWLNSFLHYLSNAEQQHLHGKNNSIFVEYHFSLKSAQHNYFKAIAN